VQSSLTFATEREKELIFDIRRLPSRMNKGWRAQKRL
jgi:hypothetical protein